MTNAQAYSYNVRKVFTGFGRKNQQVETKTWFKDNNNYCVLLRCLMETILVYTFSHVEQVLLRHNTQHNNTQNNDTQHNDTQHNDTQHNGLIYDIQHKWSQNFNALPLCCMSLCWVLHLIYHYAECQDAECCYAECHYSMVSLCWMSICMVSLCWVSLCWLSLCWVSICWMSLCMVSLCWMSSCLVSLCWV